MNKQFLFVNRKPPYGTLHAKEALDAVLMASAFGQTISVLFLDDGVFQLKKEQNPTTLEMKSHSASLAALNLYDVTAIFVGAESLTARGLSENDLIMPVKLLTASEISTLMEQQDVILSF